MFGFDIPAKWWFSCKWTCNLKVSQLLDSLVSQLSNFTYFVNFSGAKVRRKPYHPQVSEPQDHRQLSVWGVSRSALLLLRTGVRPPGSRQWVSNFCSRLFISDWIVDNKLYKNLIFSYTKTTDIETMISTLFWTILLALSLTEEWYKSRIVCYLFKQSMHIFINHKST